MNKQGSQPSNEWYYENFGNVMTLMVFTRSESTASKVGISREGSNAEESHL